MTCTTRSAWRASAARREQHEPAVRTIKTFDNQLITIPNNNVWNDTITNITGSHERRVDLMFGISYADDFGKAQDILRAILAQHPKVLETPAPTIRLHELSESVRLICRPWAKTEDYWDVYWDVMEAVEHQFDNRAYPSVPAARCAFLCRHRIA